MYLIQVQWHWLEKWLYFMNKWSWQNSWWTTRYLKTESIPNKEELHKAEEAATAASSTMFLPNLEDKGEELHKAEKAATAASSTISLPNLKPSSGFKDFQYEVPGLHNKMKQIDSEIINLVSSDEEVYPVRNESSDTLPLPVPINKVPKVQNPPAHPTQLENMQLLIDLLERMSRINSEFFQIFLEPKDEHCYVPTAHHKDWPKILTWSQMKTAYEQGYNYLSEVTNNKRCSKRLFRKLWCFPHPSVFP